MMNVLRVDNETKKAVIELSYDEVVKLSNAFIEKIEHKSDSAVVTEESKMLRWQMSLLHNFMKEKGSQTDFLDRIFHNAFGK